MNWEKYICIIEELDVQYNIIENNDDFIVYRCSNANVFQDGILGTYKGSVGVCVCIAVFNAIGLPPNSHCSGNIDYVKDLAEKDLINLRDGYDNVFITEFYKGKQNDASSKI